MKQIQLVPYSDLWPLAFEKEKNALLQSIGAWVEDIQHVGSTAIPGIAAKPIIDIMIGLRSLDDADENCIPAIQSMGYEYLQEYENLLPNRRYFHKITSIKPTKLISSKSIPIFGNAIFSSAITCVPILR